MEVSNRPNPAKKPKMGILEDHPFIDCSAIALATGFRVGAQSQVYWQYHKGPTSDVIDVEILSRRELVVRFQSNERQFGATIRYKTSKPNYGGKRYWFRCLRCRKPTRRLYSVCNHLRCRVCHRLVHQSTRTSHIMERAKKFIEKWQSIYGKLRPDQLSDLVAALQSDVPEIPQR